ncbi:MAG: hypothetical protein ABIR17_00450 [Pseudolysinimonas sp.]|uniref:hypothetical protein n=1 Tax=Pseudolysinimonas sp. TaxID=2680009 RepID=UPI0032665B83
MTGYEGLSGGLPGETVQQMAYQYIDSTCVGALVRDLRGDVGACLQFIGDFVRAWDARIARISTATERQEPDDATAALLSLATSSEMVGARYLASYARELHAEVRATGTLQAAGVARLAQFGMASCAELRDLARAWSVPAP